MEDTEDCCNDKMKGGNEVKFNDKNQERFWWTIKKLRVKVREVGCDCGDKAELEKNISNLN